MFHHILQECAHELFGVPTPLDVAKEIVHPNPDHISSIAGSNPNPDHLHLPWNPPVDIKWHQSSIDINWGDPTIPPMDITPLSVQTALPGIPDF